MHLLDELARNVRHAEKIVKRRCPLSLRSGSVGMLRSGCGSGMCCIWGRSTLLRNLRSVSRSRCLMRPVRSLGRLRYSRRSTAKGCYRMSRSCTSSSRSCDWSGHGSRVGVGWLCNSGANWSWMHSGLSACLLPARAHARTRYCRFWWFPDCFRLAASGGCIGNGMGAVPCRISWTWMRRSMTTHCTTVMIFC